MQERRRSHIKRRTPTRFLPPALLRCTAASLGIANGIRWGHSAIVTIICDFKRKKPAASATGFFNEKPSNVLLSHKEKNTHTLFTTGATALHCCFSWYGEWVQVVPKCYFFDFKRKKPAASAAGFFNDKPSDVLLSHGNSHTTIGATAFHC